MKPKNFDLNNPDWKKEIPIPVFEEKPEYLELYDLAWNLAHDHIYDIPGMPQNPYMDEAFLITDMWIWDTCFMMFFCKYAPNVFPGIETLNNFYKPLHDHYQLPKVTVHNPPDWTDYKDGDSVQVRIHIPDNPPLFSWAEYSYAMMTGDKEHLKELLLEHKYLQRHFAFLENMTEPGWVKDYTRAPTCLVKKENGYLWEGGRSGMDNTPRGRVGAKAEKERPNHPEMLWVDAIAQQGFSALFISKIAALLGENAIAARWQMMYEAFKKKVNDLYWDEEDGIYYDIHEKTLEKMKCLTPASFWPMLSMMPTKEQAERMASLLRNPEKLGGMVPWTTVSRDDADFEPVTGCYWRGAVWLPTAYMGTKSLENYGMFDLANECARKVVDHMYNTYKQYEPHTIWECYSPTLPTPAAHNGTRVRPDFCGWSALGPISLFIENVIGITGANAFENTLTWHLPPMVKGAIGIRNYSFGDVVTDVVYKDGVISTVSNAPYTLLFNDKPYAVPAGESTITPA